MSFWLRQGRVCRVPNKPNLKFWNFIRASETVTDLYIYDEIAAKRSFDPQTREQGTEVTSKDFVRDLSYVDTPQIVVHINSGGGDSIEAVAIGQAIKDVRSAGKRVAVPLNGLISLLNKGIDGINALKVTVPDWVPIIGGKQYGFNFPHFPQIQAHATGGTFTVPHLAVVGDAPETIVPHGNTPRNRSLLQEAARGVGAPAGGGSTYQIYWSPAIYGNSAQEVKQGILDSEREFEARMDAFLAAKERRAFA